MKILNLLFIGCFLTAISAIAQTQTNPVHCGFDHFLKMKKQHDREYYDAFVTMYDQSKGTLNGSRDGVLTIPVVFHVVHNTAEQNLPDSVLLSQLQILNEDFRRQNADAVDTRDIFMPVAADTEIEFRLATIDPNGNPTNGITRTHTTRTGFTLNIFSNDNTLDEVKRSADGGKDAWDPTRYLNIWICNITPTFLGQVMGMAYPPSGLHNWPTGQEAPQVQVDGVVVHYPTVGANNPQHMADNVAYNNLGRTMVHEVGHYLGLRHIWGDEMFADPCSEDDGIDDTPRSGGADNNACNLNANTCGAGQPDDLPDMIENYMEYTRDNCYNMFTNGQKEHMRWVLQNRREGLLTGEVLGMNTHHVQSVKLELWPNPSTHTLQVKTDMRVDAVYTITNVLGEVVEKGLLNRNSLDVSHFPTGMYVLTVQNRFQKGSQRFVKE
jgi:hypothetical protein